MHDIKVKLEEENGKTTVATIFLNVLTQLVGPMDDHIIDSDIVKMLL